MRWIILQSNTEPFWLDAVRLVADPGDAVALASQSTYQAQPGDVVLNPWSAYIAGRVGCLDGATLYETENVIARDSWWANRASEFRELCPGHWLNYSRVNASRFGDAYRPPSVSALGDRSEPIWDVLMVGSRCARRAEVVRQCRSMGLSVREVACDAPLYGEELARVLSRCRVALNVHYYLPGIFEAFRVAQALSYGCRVVSEASEDGETMEGVTVAGYEELAEVCWEVAKREAA